jgi:hypothetical protein
MRLLFVVISLCVAVSGWSQNDYLYVSDIKEIRFDQAAITSPFMDSVGHHSSKHWMHVYNEVAALDANRIARYQVTHELVQVNSVAGVEANNKRYVVATGYSTLESLNIRVLKDGKEVFRADETDQIAVEQEGTEYRMVALENVSVGCYIETVIVEMRDINRPGTYYVQNAVPIREYSMVWNTPKYIALEGKVSNMKEMARDSIIEDRRFLTFVAKDVKALQDEDYCFSERNRGKLDLKYKKIENGIFREKLWADVAMNIYNNFFEEFDKNESGVKKFVKEMKLADMKSDKEKLFALEDYFKRQIAVDPSYTSAKPTDVFKSKRANNFRRNQLFYWTLRVAEIPFELVFTCEREMSRFDKDFASDAYLSMALIYFPQQDMYMDLEDLGARAPVYDSQSHGQDALFIKFVELGGNMSPVSSVKRIKTYPVDKNIIEEKYTVDFASGAASTVTKYHKSYTGNADQSLRFFAFMVSEEERTEQFEEMIKSGQPEATITDLEITNYNFEKMDEINAPFTVKAVVTGKDLLEFAGEKVIFKVGNVIGKQAELYTEKPRQNPINVEFLHSYRRTITVNIPEGKKFSGLDQLNRNVECKDGETVYGRFLSTYKVENGQLVITIEESYLALDLELALYEQFRAVINAAADFNKIDLILE